MSHFECNKHSFDLSKERLLSIYCKLPMFDVLTDSSHSIIISYFVSGIPESLEDSRKCERMLEDMIFEDFQVFVEQSFSMINFFLGEELVELKSFDMKFNTGLS